MERQTCPRRQPPLAPPWRMERPVHEIEDVDWLGNVRGKSHACRAQRGVLEVCEFVSRALGALAQSFWVPNALATIKLPKTSKCLEYDWKLTYSRVSCISMLRFSPPTGVHGEGPRASPAAQPLGG